MSGGNVEVVRSAFDAFDRGDIEGVLGLCDEQIVITQPPELPGATPQQHGHGGVIEAFGLWPEQWDDFRIEVLETLDADDYVVVTARTGGRGKQSGVEVEMDFTFVFTVRNARIVEWQIFIDKEQALEAAGLRE